MTDVGRAFGKLILAGEHAVVHGVPAIALGIDRGASATAHAIASGPSRLHVATWSTTVTEDDGSDLGRALSALVSSVRTRVALAAVEVDAQTELPAGGGLGCSAALGVAIARALAPDASTSDIHDHAMAWEGIFHGNPSGVDAAVAARGGALQFVRDGKRCVIEPIASRVPLAFAIGHSGASSSTRTMVEGVARKLADERALVERIFDDIRAIVTGVRQAIEAGDRTALGALLDENHARLTELSLSTDAIDTLCTSARDAGALGAKLTGAGGGGCVLALAENRAAAERIVATWNARAFDGFVTELRAPSRERMHDLAGFETL